MTSRQNDSGREVATYRTGSSSARTTTGGGGTPSSATSHHHGGSHVTTANNTSDVRTYTTATTPVGGGGTAKQFIVSSRSTKKSSSNSSHPATADHTSTVLHAAAPFVVGKNLVTPQPRVYAVAAKVAAKGRRRRWREATAPLTSDDYNRGRPGAAASDDEYSNGSQSDDSSLEAVTITRRHASPSVEAAAKTPGGHHREGYDEVVVGRGEPAAASSPPMATRLVYVQPSSSPQHHNGASTIFSPPPSAPPTSTYAAGQQGMQGAPHSSSTSPPSTTGATTYIKTAGGLASTSSPAGHRGTRHDSQASPVAASGHHSPHPPSPPYNVVILDTTSMSPMRSLSPRAQRHRMVVDERAHYYRVYTPDENSNADEAEGSPLLVRSVAMDGTTINTKTTQTGQTTQKSPPPAPTKRPPPLVKGETSPLPAAVAPNTTTTTTATQEKNATTAATMTSPPAKDLPIFSLPHITNSNKTLVDAAVGNSTQDVALFASISGDDDPLSSAPNVEGDRFLLVVSGIDRDGGDGRSSNTITPTYEAMMAGGRGGYTAHSPTHSAMAGSTSGLDLTAAAFRNPYGGGAWPTTTGSPTSPRLVTTNSAAGSGGMWSAAGEAAHRRPLQPSGIALHQGPNNHPPTDLQHNNSISMSQWLGSFHHLAVPGMLPGANVSPIAERGGGGVTGGPGMHPSHSVSSEAFAALLENNGGGGDRSNWSPAFLSPLHYPPALHLGTATTGGEASSPVSAYSPSHSVGTKPLSPPSLHVTPPPPPPELVGVAVTSPSTAKQRSDQEDHQQPLAFVPVSSPVSGNQHSNNNHRRLQHHSLEAIDRDEGEEASSPNPYYNYHTTATAAADNFSPVHSASSMYREHDDELSQREIDKSLQFEVEAERMILEDGATGTTRRFSHQRESSLVSSPTTVVVPGRGSNTHYNDNRSTHVGGSPYTPTSTDEAEQIQQEHQRHHSSPKLKGVEIVAIFDSPQPSPQPEPVHQEATGDTAHATPSAPPVLVGATVEPIKKVDEEGRQQASDNVVVEPASPDELYQVSAGPAHKEEPQSSPNASPIRQAVSDASNISRPLPPPPSATSPLSKPHISLPTTSMDTTYGNADNHHGSPDEATTMPDAFDEEGDEVESPLVGDRQSSKGGVQQQQIFGASSSPPLVATRPLPTSPLSTSPLSRPLPPPQQQQVLNSPGTAISSPTLTPPRSRPLPPTTVVTPPQHEDEDIIAVASPPRMRPLSTSVSYNSTDPPPPTTVTPLVGKKTSPPPVLSTPSPPRTRPLPSSMQQQAPQPAPPLPVSAAVGTSHSQSSIPVVGEEPVIEPFNNNNANMPDEVSPSPPRRSRPLPLATTIAEDGTLSSSLVIGPQTPMPQLPSTPMVAASPLAASANIVKRAKVVPIPVALKEYAASARQYLAALKAARNKLPQGVHDAVRDVLAFATSYAKACIAMRDQVGSSAVLIATKLHRSHPWLRLPATGSASQSSSSTQETDDVVYSRLLDLIDDELIAVEAQVRGAQSDRGALRTVEHMLNHHVKILDVVFSPSPLAQIGTAALVRANKSSSNNNINDGPNAVSAACVQLVHELSNSMMSDYSAERQNLETLVAQCRKEEVLVTLLCDLYRIYPCGFLTMRDATMRSTLDTIVDRLVSRNAPVVASTSAFGTAEDLALACSNITSHPSTTATAAAAASAAVVKVFHDRVWALRDLLVDFREGAALTLKASPHRNRGSDVGGSPLVNRMTFVAQATTQVQHLGPASEEVSLTKMCADSHRYCSQSAEHFSKVHDDSDRYTSILEATLDASSKLMSRIDSYVVLVEGVVSRQQDAVRLRKVGVDHQQALASALILEAVAEAGNTTTANSMSPQERFYGIVMRQVHRDIQNLDDVIAQRTSFLARRRNMRNLLHEEVEMVKNLVQIPLHLDPTILLWEGLHQDDTDTADDRAELFGDVMEVNRQVARQSFLIIGNGLVNNNTNNNKNTTNMAAELAAKEAQAEATRSLLAAHDAQEVLAAALRRGTSAAAAATQATTPNAAAVVRSSQQQIQPNDQQQRVALLGPRGPQLPSAKAATVLNKTRHLWKTGIVTFMPNVTRRLDASFRSTTTMSSQTVRCIMQLTKDATALYFHSVREAAAAAMLSDDAVTGITDQGQDDPFDTIPPIPFKQLEMILQGPSISLGPATLQCVRFVADNDLDASAVERHVYFPSFASFMEWSDVLQVLLQGKHVLPSTELLQKLGE